MLLFFFSSDVCTTELQTYEERRASVTSAQTLSPYASANFDDLQQEDDHPTIVAYVLAVNDHCARLYHFDHVRTGDRTAMHKVTFEEGAAAAGAWVSPVHGPALTVVSVSGTIATYALPSTTCCSTCRGVVLGQRCFL